ncbi:VOC family protein [Paenibacillus gorillae]|uniref:VOC family protein n=1 Tax=Paenibacillus gorillae TaxID=1243662 RepID=UPI0004B1395E|nr:VOC family protein [Paenibacillus gorillae]
MRIHRVRLLTKNLAQLQEFYSHLLGLPLLDRSKDSFTVSVGQSYLTFERTENAGENPYYHFAFDIPNNKMDETIHWLSSKKVSLNLLPNDSYKIHSKTWDATSIYFDDPSGNIVEFISRHSLHNEVNSFFSSMNILNISEIGLVVNDVNSTIELLESNLKLDAYNDNNNSFAAVGDANGLFILSAHQRIWLGSDKKADIFRTEVTIEGNDKGTFNVGSYPYKIIVK